MEAAAAAMEEAVVEDVGSSGYGLCFVDAAVDAAVQAIPYYGGGVLT